MTRSISHFLSTVVFVIVAFVASIASAAISVRGMVVDFKKERRLVDVVAETESREWILQFEEPLRGETRREMKAHGIEILRYLPPHAFVLRGERSKLQLLRNQEIAGWATWRAVFKMDPTLAALVSRSPLAKHKVSISTFEPSSLAEVRLRLRQMTTEVRIDGLIIETLLTGAQIRNLADGPGIENFELQNTK